MIIYLINTDLNVSVRWEVPDEIMDLMLTSIATSLGEIPNHKYPTGGNSIVIYLRDMQVDRLIEVARSIEQNEGVKTFIREIEYLKVPPLSKIG